jgi:polysaccharide biosynthesis protein PslG
MSCRLNRACRAYVLFLILVVVLTAACGGETAVSPTHTPPSTATPTPTPLPTLPDPAITINSTPVALTREPWQLFASPEYGVHLSQWWNVDDVLPRDLEMANEMGFGWVKQTFSWRDIEGITKGAYDWYRPDRIVEQVENAGLNLLVRIDRPPNWTVANLPPERIRDNQPPQNLQDFGDFCFALGERFKDRIAAYQVWNEPNLSREWGDQPPNPVEYTALLRICYEGIKQADPNAIVISAGLAPTGTILPAAMPDDEFLQGMYDAGAAPFFDVLGLNAPGYKAPPETSPEEGADNSLDWGGNRFNVFRRVEDMRAIMVQNGDANKQVAILEMGWILQQNYHPDYEWFGVTEQQQANYLVGAYQYARENWQPWIGLMTFLYFADHGWTPEEHEQYWWSVVRPDGSTLMAYDALSQMEK